MDNIVTCVAKNAGGLDKLAAMHGVTYQAAWLWEKKGYFPLRQMSKVQENFPSITAEQLMDAYRVGSHD